MKSSLNSFSYIYYGNGGRKARKGGEKKEEKKREKGQPLYVR